MVVRLFDEPEFEKDGPDVAFHGAGAHGEPFDDALVGSPFGHELKHFAFSVAELVEGSLSPFAFEEKRREDAVRDEGWEVVRWTWPDLASPERLANRVRRARARGSRHAS